MISQMVSSLQVLWLRYLIISCENTTLYGRVHVDFILNKKTIGFEEGRMQHVDLEVSVTVSMAVCRHHEVADVTRGDFRD
jgi:hypothetical protein